MKKLFAIFLLAPAFVFAGPTAPAPKAVFSDQSQSSLIDFSKLPRVLFFHGSKNFISNTGQILVCTTDVSFSGKCNEKIEISNIKIPGHELSHYEYRFNPNGYRDLLVYFKKI